MKVILYTGKYMPPFYFRPFYPIESEQIWDWPNWIKHNQVWTNLRQDEIVCMCEREKNHVRQKKTYIEYWYVIYMKNIIKECQKYQEFSQFLKHAFQKWLWSISIICRFVLTTVIHNIQQFLPRQKKFPGRDFSLRLL